MGGRNWDCLGRMFKNDDRTHVYAYMDRKLWSTVNQEGDGAMQDLFED